MRARELTIRLPEYHAKQAAFVNARQKRIACRAGRRGGKTMGVAGRAVERFLDGRRVLYAAPTAEQLGRFWATVCNALVEPLRAKVFIKNETEHIIELRGTEQRIRAKTAWNADTLRGDYADELILDEYQLMNEDAWEVVGAPMMLDTNGTAIFVFTPPSFRMAGVSKAQDPRHASKLYKRAEADTTGRWAAFTFTSHDNPYLSKAALDEIVQDMSPLAYRQEIMAEDIDEIPGALWTRALIEETRVRDAPELVRVVVGVDPKVDAEANSEAGIVVGGVGVDGHGYLLADVSQNGSPEQWAQAVAAAFETFDADHVVAEGNQGGDMVMSVLRAAFGWDGAPPVRLVHATRGKYTRAEPIATLWGQKRIHAVGSYPALEDQMCSWLPGGKSPDRCLAAGTSIVTDKGDIPIERVEVGTRVWTRLGWRRVLASNQTSPAAPTVTVYFTDGRHLTGTTNHPVYTHNRGFVQLGAIVWDDIIDVCNWHSVRSGKEHTSWQGKWSGSMELPLSGIREASRSLPRATSIRKRMASVYSRWGRFIARCGSSIMGRSRLDGTFTTRTATSPTTTSAIWKPSRLPTTRKSRTHSILISLSNGDGLMRLGFGHWRRLGIAAPRGEHGTVSMPSEYTRTASPSSGYAPSAARSTSRLPIARLTDFVPAPASVDLTSARSDITKSARARSVVARLRSRNPISSRPVRANVVRCCDAETQAVYNLQIEGAHEFYANGVLVHNCDAMVWTFTELMGRREKQTARSRSG